GVDYLLSNKAAVDANSAFRPGWVRTGALKDAYAKMGFAFDPDGNFVQGTNLFDNLKRNDVVDRLTGQYLRTKWQDRAINSEDQPTRRFTKEDLKNPNVTE